MAAGVKYKINTLGETFDLRQNTALGADVADTVRRRYGAIDYEYGIKSASTDFVSVASWASIHSLLLLRTELVTDETSGQCYLWYASNGLFGDVSKLTHSSPPCVASWVRYV